MATRNLQRATKLLSEQDKKIAVQKAKYIANKQKSIFLASLNLKKNTHIQVLSPNKLENIYNVTQDLFLRDQIETNHAVHSGRTSISILKMKYARFSRK